MIFYFLCFFFILLKLPLHVHESPWKTPCFGAIGCCFQLAKSLKEQLYNRQASYVSYVSYVKRVPQPPETPPATPPARAVLSTIAVVLHSTKCSTTYTAPGKSTKFALQAAVPHVAALLVMIATVTAAVAEVPLTGAVLTPQRGVRS
jgi:hypothetical protein